VDSHTLGIMEIGPPPGHERTVSRETSVMGWFLALSSMFWPRLFIIGFWIFGSELGKAFSSWVIPAAGFVIAPWTTVAYAFMWSVSSDKVSGAEWIVVALAVIADVITWAGVRRLRS
jgi:hypothetical protein